MESPRKPERDLTKLKRLNDLATELRVYRDECAREYYENNELKSDRVAFYKATYEEAYKDYCETFKAWLALSVEYGEIVYCDDPMPLQPMVVSGVEGDCAVEGV